jgi:putative Holliday junction resolvase
MSDAHDTAALPHILARPERLLGIDLGTRRVGVAIADPRLPSAWPYAVLAREDAALMARIAAIAAEEEATALVVGLPLHMSGAEDAWTAEVRAWAAAAGEALGLPVEMADERLSSWDAEQRLGPSVPGSRAARERRRGAIDAQAAAVILDGVLAARRAAAPPQAPPDHPARDWDGRRGEHRRRR